MSTPKAEKILVLGVDGLDPRLAKHCLNKGLMPNLQRLIDLGACREDLVMLGGLPTVTPPMWTTLATGAYAGTHGITAFYNQHPEDLARRIYALDSRMCKAEQLWNVFAESGKKTLVWHWPGSSWPPTSDNSNLSVVDGTQPIQVNMGVALIDWEKICIADAKNDKVVFKPHTSTGNDGAGCIITNLEDVIEKEEKTETTDGRNSAIKNIMGNSGSSTIIMDENDTEIVTLGQVKLDEIDSPISEPRNWANAPQGAKEFAYLTSEGLIRRPCLIVPNEKGIYDKVYIYKSKKDMEPIAILNAEDKFTVVYDEIIAKEEQKKSYRTMRIMNIAEDGSYVKLWMSMAFDSENASVWHPKSLLNEITANVGPIAQVSLATGKNPEYAQKLLIEGWDRYCQWQADCLNYFMNDYDVIFSHLHNVDAIGHQIWHFANEKQSFRWDTDAKMYQEYLERIYMQTDEYIGRFLPYLDKGWTIILTSDHGLISEENHPPGLGEGGVNATVMRELGYTVLKKDENGNDLREIDWSKTKAIASRGCHINLNIKGRNPEGIVDPADQYELERQIITDLYNYKDPHTGQRVVALAVRNKDAVVFGMNGPECGDIVYFMDEGYNIIHMDSLATFEGHYHTSVSPIFVAAGNGIKAGFKTDRVIRQVDVAPTVAVLGGVRIPEQCEGAPVYQILK